MTAQHSYEAIETRLSALEEKMEKLEGSIDKLITVLQQGQGVVKTLKFIFLITAPFVAAVVWLKEHVKL